MIKKYSNFAGIVRNPTKKIIERAHPIDSIERSRWKSLQVCCQHQMRAWCYGQYILTNRFKGILGRCSEKVRWTHYRWSEEMFGNWKPRWTWQVSRIFFFLHSIHSFCEILNETSWFNSIRIGAEKIFFKKLQIFSSILPKNSIRWVNNTNLIAKSVRDLILNVLFWNR